MDDTITQHPNSILNPDVVAEWKRECTKSQRRDKAERGRAMLPNIVRYWPSEIPRAFKAVELWEEASR